jgi:hypothetical protein
LFIKDFLFSFHFLGAAAAQYMTPYTYAALPQAGTAAGAGGYPGLNPYQSAAGASLQEARLQ